MKFLTLALTLFAFSAQAQTLDDMKSKANDHMAKKMETIQTARSCINSAGSKEAFKACKYDMHEEMKMQKQQMIEEKKEEKTSL